MTRLLLSEVMTVTVNEKGKRRYVPDTSGVRHKVIIEGAGPSRHDVGRCLGRHIQVDPSHR